MQERTLKVLFNKAGGNAGSTSYTTKINVPKSWLNEMNITPDEREVLVSFDGQQIIIKKKEQP